MKSISVALAAHFAQDVTTIATLWKLTRRDGEIFGFTDADKPIFYDGTTYEADAGVTPSQIEIGSEMAVSNLEFSGFLQSAAFQAEDLEAGIWDRSEMLVMRVNYADLSQGAIIDMKGELGEVGRQDGHYRVEFRGLMQKLQKQVTRAYLPSCDADLGDARCGVDLASFTVTGTVSEVTSNREFAASDVTETEAEFYRFGVVTWLTGENAGRTIEVKAYDGSPLGIELYLPMPDDIAIGDTFTISAGCDKTFETCLAKFSNTERFRGFPHIPGMDQILKPGGT